MIAVARTQEGAATTAQAAPGLECDPETKRRIVNRLKRARGQLDAVIDAAERGASCKETITQLSAVTHALNRAGFVIIASAMRNCVDAEQASPEGDDGGPGTAADGTVAPVTTVDELEKIFLSLV
ncbi:DNA-binding transcriptional regulator, FrmR family [Actinomyces ruminicola]|uniref:DNA-binding transcriptional regulator, FrmR family n=1 Tax=Actinomyces ruminicola TaxID=332524 RepID=A0A1G9ZQ17_9ACTO|nr:metal-sensing transcriptional repressor [Actinomyces ruminicola]SDN22696.1 DNA-binding transcriptional regulator, FrmR family [Actinomyces ruminicola]